MLWGKDLPLDGVLSSEAPRGELPETELPRGSGGRRSLGVSSLEQLLPGSPPVTQAQTQTGRNALGRRRPSKICPEVLAESRGAFCHSLFRLIGHDGAF